MPFVYFYMTLDLAADGNRAVILDCCRRNYGTPIAYMYLLCSTLGWYADTDTEWSPEQWEEYLSVCNDVHQKIQSSAARNAVVRARLYEKNATVEDIDLWLLFFQPMVEPHLRVLREVTPYIP